MTNQEPAFMLMSMKDGKIYSVVGVDVGSVTGLTFLQFLGTDLVRFEFFEITAEAINELFYFNVARAVEQKIWALNPDLVVFEGYAYGGRGFFNVNQAELQGQIKRGLVDYGTKYVEAHISSMRKAILNNGRAKKKDAKNFAEEFFGSHGGMPKFKQAHVYDSTIPAILGFYYLTGRLTVEYSEVIKQSIVDGGRK